MTFNELKIGDKFYSSCKLYVWEKNSPTTAFTKDGSGRSEWFPLYQHRGQNHTFALFYRGFVI